MNITIFSNSVYSERLPLIPSLLGNSPNRPSYSFTWTFVYISLLQHKPSESRVCAWRPLGTSPSRYTETTTLKVLNKKWPFLKIRTIVYKNAAAAAKLLQSCLTLCNPIDSSPPGSAVPGILQARTLEWVAISFSNAWKWKEKVKSLSHIRLFATPWTAAYQAPPSMRFLYI